LGEYAFAYTRIQSIVVPDKVTELKDGVFSDTYLTDITLGKQIAVIHERALYASTMIQYMYIAATTPPLYPSRDGIYQTTLYVPKGTYDAYYAVSPWRSVSKIIESDSAVRFYPVSCTTEGGYTRISLSNRTSGYSTEGDRNVFMSVIAGDSVKLYVDGSGGYHMPPPTPIKQVFLNGVDVTEKNEISSRYTFIYNAKADGPLHFHILFGYAVDIQSPELKQSNVHTSPQHIVIRATESNLPVFIYDIMGRLVHQSIIQEGDRYIPVRPGMYIVKVKNKTEKVVVRK
jgi:hypothetical protein